MKKSLARTAAVAAVVAVAAAAVLTIAPGAGAESPAEPPAEPTPPGVTQIIPRGRLAAVFHPVFVPAADAALPDDAWVLGVVMDGEAHAYSLNLLNHHEVVNDKIGGRPIAAVWCPLANTGVVYDRKIDEQVLQFEPSGALQSASLVMRDMETNSWWSIMTKNAIAGDLEGAALVEIPVSAKMPWGQWRRMHPETSVLAVDGAVHDDVNPYADYFTSEKTFRELLPDDDRLPAKEAIFAFHPEGKPVVVRNADLEGGRTYEVGGRRAYFHRTPGASVFESTRAYWVPEDAEWSDLEGAEVLPERVRRWSPIAGIDTFWYNWAFQNPETRILE